MDLKISQLSEYDSVKDFYTVCFQNNTTVKYNLGTLESKVNSTVNACGIEEFDSTKTYQVEDFCLYEGNAYKFIFTHTGAWNSSHVTQTTAIDEILALTEVEDKQETTFLVTSDDPNLDLSEKRITINIESETNPRIVSTDSTGKAIVNIPRDKTFSSTLGSLAGYTTSPTLNSKTLSDSSTLSFRYYKETSQRTFTVYLTVSGTNANINDFVGKEIIYFLDDLKTFGSTQLSLDTLDPTKASVEITWNESTALSGTIIYPNVNGYYLGPNTTTRVQFQSDKTNTTLDYIREQLVQEVSYVKSSGKQWIDTGINGGNNNLKIEFKFAYATYSKYGYFFGNYGADTSDSTRFTIGSSDNGSAIANVNSRSNPGGNIVLGSSSIAKNTDIILTLERTKATIEMDGTSKEYTLASPTSGTANTNNIAIFANRPSGTIYNNAVTFYYMKIWDGETLVRHFVPYSTDKDHGCLVDIANGNTVYFSKGSENLLLPS